MSAQKVYATKRFSFEAAHYLPNYDGKCANLHGHSYKLEVCVSNERDFVTNSGRPEMVKDNTVKANEFMVLDFSVLKGLVQSHVISKFDHSNLNDLFAVPTAEAMCVHIYNAIQHYLSEVRDGKSFLKLEWVKLWETEDSYAEYRGEIV